MNLDQTTTDPLVAWDAWRVAVHESGHAVTCWLLGRPFSHVGGRPLPDPSPSWHTDRRPHLRRYGLPRAPRPELAASPRGRLALEQGILVALGGWRAEVLHRDAPRKLKRWDCSDMDFCISSALCLLGADREGVPVLEPLVVRADQLLRRADARAAVLALARALLERGRLSRAEALDVITAAARGAVAAAG